MSYIGSELRRLRRENTRLNRRLGLQRMPGKVVERDVATRKIRLDLGEDPATGNRVLSPWVRVQGVSAGAFKFFVLPSVNEQMYLESPSGVVGADSLATFGAFDSENRYPEQDADELVLENGDTRFSLKSGELKLSVGGTEFLLSAAGLKAKAARYDFE